MKELDNFYCKNYNDDGFATIEEKCKNQCIDCKTEAIQALQQRESEWISVEDRLPTIDEFGEKVLLYRITNDSQKSLSITIHDTNMVKYCENSTMWMPLPTPPNK